MDISRVFCKKFDCNTCGRVSFLIKLHEACNFIKKETLAKSSEVTYIEYREWHFSHSKKEIRTSNLYTYSLGFKLIKACTFITGKEPEQYAMDSFEISAPVHQHNFACLIFNRNPQFASYLNVWVPDLKNELKISRLFWKLQIL